MRIKPPAALLPIAVACCMLLSSCYVFWNTGERLKEKSVTYTGLDMVQPVGGVAYKAGGKFYVQVPEVTYQTKHLLLGAVTVLGGRFSDEPDETHITNLTPTGRTLWCEVDGYIQEDDGKFRYQLTPPPDDKPVARLVAGCPTGAKRIPFGAQRTSKHIFHNEIIQTDTTRSEHAWLYNVGAAPLTYVVDPVLSVGSTVVGNLALIPLAAGSAIVCTLAQPFISAGQQQQMQETEPTEKP